MIGRDFLLAGRATFTLCIPVAFAESHSLSSHYTYRVTHKPASAQYRETYFVYLLIGPDNENDYTYMGILNPATGFIRLTDKSCAAESSYCVALLRRALAAIWDGRGMEILAAGFDLIHAGRCGRCGRTLTDPESCAVGIGPECRRIMAGG